MTSEQESVTKSEQPNGFRLLDRSLVAVRCLFAILVVFSIAFLIGFGFQFQVRDEFGDFFPDYPGAWSFLVGHLLRGVVAALLAWFLWRYVAAVKQGFKAGDAPSPEFYVALNRVWNGVAIGIALLLLYTIWLVFGVGLVQPSRALSPRFQSSPGDKGTGGVEVRLAENDPGVGLQAATHAETGMTYYLHKETLLNPGDVAETRVVQSDSGDPAVEFTIAKQAIRKVRDATGAHLSKPIALLVDGKIASVAIVHSQIGEKGIIGGQFTHPMAMRIAKGLVGLD